MFERVTIQIVNTYNNKTGGRFKLKLIFIDLIQFRKKKEEKAKKIEKEF